MNNPQSEPTYNDWQKLVAKYSAPNFRLSVWQIINTFVPFIALWCLMYLSLQTSYWLTLALAVPTAGLLIRIFIILHDCGHNAFFKSTKANNFWGVICGIFTFTPYFQWRHGHAIHHATSGDLDRRGIGDVETITVNEYRALSPWKKFLYRLYRNPLIMFGLGPFFIFFIRNRFTEKKDGPRERSNVHFTNLVLLVAFTSLGLLLGFDKVFLVQFTALMLAGVGGVWLFYVQHQFEDTYWRHHPEWKYVPSALQGSSYFKLPKILQWFTGNIGFHHIHHLSPRIPNYNLQRCYDDNQLFQHVTTITLLESLKTLSLKLWDEDEKRLVGFGHLKKMAKPAKDKVAEKSVVKPKIN